jgi:hypothetical protein
MVDIMAAMIFLVLNMRGQDGSCNGCDGFLELTV